MRLKNEIQRAVRCLNANALVNAKISDAKIETHINQTIADLQSNSFNFSKYDSIIIRQGAKQRHVKLYKLFSTENILCQYMKQILDRRFKVKYPNRNKAVHTLFDFLGSRNKCNEKSLL